MDEGVPSEERSAGGAVSQACEEIVALWMEQPYSRWCCRAYRVAALREVTPSLL
jgi:hypothetical protein